MPCQCSLGGKGGAWPEEFATEPVSHDCGSARLTHTTALAQGCPPYIPFTEGIDLGTYQPIQVLPVK